MEAIYVALFCVSVLGVLGSEPQMSQMASEARVAGGWDGCGDIACIADYDPVCGSDGKTYSNICMMSVAQCGDVSIQMAHKGECQSADQAKADQSRDTPQADCEHIHCPKDYRPVCGSDHKSYFSNCLLEKARCQNNPTLKVEYEGLCQREGLPVHPKAEIPDHIPEDCRTFCTMDYDPVCGSDGKTYSNKCELDSVACVQRSGVTMTYEGPCAASRVSPQDSPQRMKRSNKCDNKCPKMYKPVCGSDGKTYANECMLLVEKCQLGGALAVAHKGEC